jgi:uncharacterized RDD family membrane protein YckC
VSAPPAGNRLLDTPRGAFEIASFWRRAGAFAIDMLVFSITALIVLTWASEIAAGLGADIDLEDEEQVEDLAPLFYGVWFTGVLFAELAFNSFGWSPGKAALTLRVVNERGERPGLSRGLGRTIGSIASFLAFGLGYLWAAFDRRTQTWHDKIGGTFVVREVEAHAMQEPPRGSPRLPTE